MKIRVILTLANVPMTFAATTTWKEALKVISTRTAQFPTAKVSVRRGTYGTAAIVNIEVPGVS